MGSAFLEVLESAVDAARHARRGLALLYVDLDRFRYVDELLGREQADRLLQEAANRLAAAVGPGNRLERLGGDDFAALIHGVGELAPAAVVAAQLLEQCRKPHVYECICMRLTASIGIGLFPLHAEDGPALLRCAERALYHAKVAGRNRYFPEPVPPSTLLMQIYGA